MVRLLFFTAPGGAGCAAPFAPGCHTPTQVTLDISLAHAKCEEVNQTAITIGTEPAKTEDSVQGGFVTTQTTDCDRAT